MDRRRFFVLFFPVLESVAAAATAAAADAAAPVRVERTDGDLSVVGTSGVEDNIVVGREPEWRGRLLRLAERDELSVSMGEMDADTRRLSNQRPSMT